MIQQDHIDDSEADLLAAALKYASLGYSVFPCAPGAKRPITDHGFLDATTDEAQIRRWWKDQPHANIGIPTAGLIVIDRDKELDGPPNPWPGDVARLADLAAAPTSITPRGGRHHVFRQPPGKDWRNTESQVAPNVDTCGNGGYIVVAPSIVNGRRYRWKKPLCPLQELPEPPIWLSSLLDAIAKPKEKKQSTNGHVPKGSLTKYVQAALDAQLGRVAMSRDGTRNSTLNKAAFALGQLVGAGVVDRQTVEQQLADAAARCGLPEREAAATIRSGLDAGIAQPRKMLGANPATPCSKHANGEKNIENAAIIATSVEELSESSKTAKEGIKVGGLVFVLDSARRTPAKIIAEIEVRNAVGPIDRLTLTGTAASRKEFVKAAGRLAPGQVDAEELAGKFLAAAAQLAHVRTTIEGITVRQIVAEKVPPAFRFAYRTDKGAWSEARGCEVTRAEFIAHTPASLIESCKSAADFQGDGAPDDIAVLRAVDAALRITWPTLLSELPRMESAELPRDSEAAKRFRNAIIQLWSRPFAGESITRESGEQVNLRASLRSRVTSQINKQQRNRPAGWVKVHPAYSAWWREHCDEHGETHIYLAMRYELATEGQVAIPGVESQVSLLTTGSKCGAIDSAPPVPRKLSKGAARLAVLTRELTDYLLAEPIEGDESGDAERPPASPTVTEEEGSAGEEPPK
jgi:Bifunctional DNA primase/polymerase, N-terminal